MSEENMKKKSKLPIIITIIVLIILIAGGSIGGYFGYKYVQKNKTTGTQWGDTYYTYLKSAIAEDSNKEEYGLKDDMENIELQFIEVGETNPVMIMNYDFEGNSYINIYRTKGENNVDKIVHQEPAKVEFLYNIQYKSYAWYIHEESETEDSYKKIYTILENPDKNNEAENTITKGDSTTQNTLSGETITLSKFDETFVKPEIESSIKVEFTEDIDIKDLKNNITNGVDGYKTQDEIVSEEVKSATENKVNEVETTKQKIETAKTEIKAEEERKAAEEAAKGLKVGNYTIKYGTYKDPEFGTRFVLNQDGTCVYDGKKFTYKVEKHDFSQDINPDYRIGIVFYQPNGEVYFAFFPHNSTTLYSCGIESLVYTGN